MNTNQEIQTGYRGKTFDIPSVSSNGFHLAGNPLAATHLATKGSPVLDELHTIWNVERFLHPRLPVTIATLEPSRLRELGADPLPRVLDMPIKFPGTDYRLPENCAPILDIIKTVANFEALWNQRHIDEYYCYLTIDRAILSPGETLREAPCHVDGFQGARWNPKLPINHTYTVSDILPTTYYPQPFDLSRMDESKHDFFGVMNRQVRDTNSLFAWRPPAGALTLMDAYTVHRGSESPIVQARTFVRISFEVRIFDREGNTHNPMFDYSWPMYKRDIEGLNLVPFYPPIDPSLDVFPHQNLDGTPRVDAPRIPGGKRPKTQPVLKPESFFRPDHLIWKPGAELLSQPGWLYRDEILRLSEARR